MGQGTESCADRPTEVSVIRFVSRNRTIEEIAPKKEVYTCKQRGCGKIFTNQDEYKTHEALEALKIRFICREPGCGEELSDPGSMWRHYQEWHNNETNVFICPYTNCGSFHTTSGGLEEHIESCHRQPPTLPTEPEIICFEGPVETTAIDDESVMGLQSNDEYEQQQQQQKQQQQQQQLGSYEQENGQQQEHECKKPPCERTNEDYANNESPESFHSNEPLCLGTDTFILPSKYDVNATRNECTENANEKHGLVYVNGDVTTATTTTTMSTTATTTTTTATTMTIMMKNPKKKNERRTDLECLERIFRNEHENSENGENGDITRHENENANANTNTTNSNCTDDDDDEEYTPKKQRMSRCKQEVYLCAVNGCGKKYKYISHYRHHQDSHKLVAATVAGTIPVANPSKSIARIKQGKASTVSFFLCKIPGCGAQVNNVTGLWKHYQDNHASSKLPVGQATKNNEVFRCKIPGCEVELSSTLTLCKHFSEAHSHGTNTKTGNGAGSFHYAESFNEDATAQQGNLKTDFNAKHNINNDYKTTTTTSTTATTTATTATTNDEQRLASIVKKETRD